MSAHRSRARAIRTRTRTTIRAELDGNFCRCTGYHNIVKAVQQGAAAMSTLTEPTMSASTASANRSAARKTIASSPAPASTPTTSIVPHQTHASSCARRTRTRRSAASTRPRRKPRPAWSRSSPAPISTGVNGLPCGWLITSTDGTPMNEPPHPVLAQGKVRYVGDPVALVVAETLAPGEGRRRADRRRLRRAAGGRQLRRRAQARRAAVHDGAPGNLCYTGPSATRRRSTPRSRRPRTSRSSTSSTTG